MSRTIRKEIPVHKRPRKKPNPLTRHTEHKKERHENRQLTKRIITFPTHEEE